MRPRTRLLSAVRKAYRGTLVETALAALSRRSGWPIWRPFVPGHQLYRPAEWRRFEANGLKWHVDISDYIGHGAYFGLDRSMERLFALCELDSVVLDVGVNIGWTALNLARLSRAGQVIGFEPDPDNFRACEANLQLNHLSNLRIEPLGLADRPGEATIIVENEHNRGGNCISEDGGITVELTTIDAYCARHGVARVDLIKIDTEGFEERIIRGGIEVLSRDHPVLFIEVNDRNLARYGGGVQSLFETLKALGYSSFRVAGSDREIEDPASLAGLHVDMIVRTAGQVS